ncbi:MAG: 8-amino-7-oxononanoate synthase [Thermodesulfobacteriota bacterium]
MGEPSRNHQKRNWAQDDTDQPNAGVSQWHEELDELRRKDLFRSMPHVHGFPGRTILVNGKDAINFSANNYLDLAGHPAVAEACIEYVRRFGVGSTASRLIAGNNSPFEEIEAFIAKWKGTEAALFFGSGYQANMGVITALTGTDDLIASDALNHASIVDGCRLSRARTCVYPHLDLERLEEILRQPGFRRKLVVTESVFSMDGDRAPLTEIDGLCQRHGAALMVDEAHATGVWGPQGQGLAAEQGAVPDIQMGTLSKAVGTYGAYVAGSRELIEMLTNRARSLIYTTGVPPAIAGAALAALRIVASEEGLTRRRRLQQNVSDFTGLLLSRMGRKVNPGHILPFVIGDSRRTMEVSAACLNEGIFVHGIRYPTVPEGSARLRFTLMSAHTDADLTKAVDVLERVLEEEERESRMRGDPLLQEGASPHPSTKNS